MKMTIPRCRFDHTTRWHSTTLQHTVYRKPNHTDRYLKYRSFCHLAVKSSVCKTLVSRAYKLYDKDNITEKLDHLNVVLQQNGFPPENISLPPPCTSDNEIKQEFFTSICLTYLVTTSHQIERILASSDMKVYHCSNKKIYQLLRTHQDKTDKNLKARCIPYSIYMRKLYIGETGRNLKLRQKEDKDCCPK